MAHCGNGALRLLTKLLIVYFAVTSIGIVAYAAWKLTCCSSNDYGFPVENVRFLDKTPPTLSLLPGDDEDDDEYNIGMEEDEEEYEEEFEKSENSTSSAINPHPFHFTIPQTNACWSPKVPGRAPYILTLVVSDPKHAARRSHIRRTWAHKTIRQEMEMVMLFLLGLPSDKRIAEAIQRENDRFHDIVQENFVDSYQNLTYKSIMAMKWVSRYCSNASYALKIDDDVVFNPFVLSRYLHSRDEKSRDRKPPCDNCFICKVITDAVVVRQEKAKFFVDEETYYGSLYPHYCSGPAYLFRGHMAARLYEASHRMKFFFLEDIYITGFLAFLLHMDHEDARQLYAFDKQAIVRSAAFLHKNVTTLKRHKIWRKIEEYWLNDTQTATSSS